MKYTNLLQSKPLRNEEFTYVDSIKPTKNVYTNLEHVEYEVDNIVVNPSTIIIYPQNVQLTFDGVTKYYDRQGNITATTTQQIVVTLTIETDSELIGTYYWNGVPVNYTLQKELGVASVLYTKEDTSMEGGFDYNVVTINKTIAEEMVNRGWTPIAILVATSEQCGEGLDGDDRYCALHQANFAFSRVKNTTTAKTTDNIKVYAFSYNGENECHFSTNIASAVTGNTPICFQPYTLEEALNIYSGYNQTLELVKQHTSSASKVVGISGGTAIYGKFYETNGIRNQSAITEIEDIINYTSYIACPNDEIIVNDSPYTKYYISVSGNVCPPAKITQLYSTKGTNKGDWYLPSLGELNILKLQSHGLLSKTESYLNYKYIQIYSDTYTSLPKNMITDYANDYHFFAENDVEFIEEYSTYTEDDLVAMYPNKPIYDDRDENKPLTSITINGRSAYQLKRASDGVYEEEQILDEEPIYYVKNTLVFYDSHPINYDGYTNKKYYVFNIVDGVNTSVVATIGQKYLKKYYRLKGDTLEDQKQNYTNKRQQTEIQKPTGYAHWSSTCAKRTRSTSGRIDGAAWYILNPYIANTMVGSYPNYASESFRNDGTCRVFPFLKGKFRKTNKA